VRSHLRAVKWSYDILPGHARVMLPPGCSACHRDANSSSRVRIRRTTGDSAAPSGTTENHSGADDRSPGPCLGASSGPRSRTTVISYRQPGSFVNVTCTRQR